jgi:hypothetical protein
MSATPKIGRNARLVKGATAIGYGKNISTDADAEEIKVYSMDKLTPEIIAAGKQSFKWSMDRLFTDATYLSLLLAGTSFDMIFAPEGTPLGSSKYETWTGCKILHRGTKAGEDDGIRENLNGSATGVTVPA